MWVGLTIEARKPDQIKSLSPRAMGATLFCILHLNGPVSGQDRAGQGRGCRDRDQGIGGRQRLLEESSQLWSR